MGRERLQMEWEPRTLDAALARTVASAPTGEALVFKGERLSWQDLDRWSDRLAAAFLAQGVARGHTVATLMMNNFEWVAIFFALAKIGAVIVPVNFRYKAQELTYVLKQSEARMLIATVRHADRDRALVLAEAVAEARTPIVVTLGESPKLGSAHTLSWQALEESADSVTELELRSAKARVAPGDLLIIQFTSGTTALPKGVELRHDQLLRSATGMSSRLGMTGEDRFFSPMPFFHIGGSTASVLTAMVCGATLCFVDYFNAGESLATIARERCTCVCGVETMFVDMLTHEAFAETNLSSLRAGWTVRNEAVFAAFPGLGSVYALSECSSLVALAHWQDSLERRRDTCGDPLDGIDIRIVDPDTHVELPAGQSGLILVRGWCVTSGYYNQPALTAELILPGGWLNTGDYGRREVTGELVYLGRIKDVLRVGGENVASVEVEAVINSHPAVLRSAVVPLPHARLNEVPVVFVSLREAKDASEKEIIEFCAERLASFKVPRHVVFVSEFPMTGSGKIQKGPLVEQARRLLEVPGQ